MITEYHRPKTIAEALALLARKDPPTLVLAGGTWVNRPSMDHFALVDLQALGLNQMAVEGNQVTIGAMVTLENFCNLPDIAPALKQAIQLETNYNLRQMATVAGKLVTATGRSSLAVILLALDTQMVWEPGNVEVNLGNWLPIRSPERPGLLVTMLKFSRLPQLCFEYVARTPGDTPVVCAAAAHWPSGRTRLVLGGYGLAPIVVMDGTEAAGADYAARDAYSQAGDQWATAEYRQEIAVVLTHRCIAAFTA
jgi:CO/xanthine dehydrogenase FAD-binding subunit